VAGFAETASMGAERSYAPAPMPGNETRRFEPFTCEQMASLLADAPFPWWICGGQAIDLFLGYATRVHADVEVGVLRRDQTALYAWLEDFEVHAASAGTLRELRGDDRGHGIDAPLHGLWCRPRGREPWAFEVLLNEGTRDEWVFRRDPRIRRPLAQAVGRTIGRTQDHIPYLEPELQLLFKAKAPRPKDDLDFAAALPALAPEQRRWLADALDTVHPTHPWSQRLEPGE
jgi:hypothetical protein